VQAFCNSRKCGQVHINRKWTDSREETQYQDQVKIFVSSLVAHVLSIVQRYLAIRLQYFSDGGSGGCLVY